MAVITVPQAWQLKTRSSRKGSSCLTRPPGSTASSRRRCMPRPKSSAPQGWRTRQVLVSAWYDIEAPHKVYCVYTSMSLRGICHGAVCPALPPFTVDLLRGMTVQYSFPKPKTSCVVYTSHYVLLVLHYLRVALSS